MVHMVMLSTEHSFLPGSAQYQWLAKDLSEVDRKKTPFVIVGGHRAMYCSNKIEGEFFTLIFKTTLWILVDQI